MCSVSLLLLACCVSRRKTQKCPLSFLPLIVRVHPAALTDRVHEEPQPVRVSLQGGWVRNGIKVDMIKVNT